MLRATTLLLKLVLHRGSLDMPAALNGFPPQPLVHSGEADESINDSASGGNLPELHTKNGSHQVEMRNGDKSPVECTDDHQHSYDDIEFLHDEFSLLSLSVAKYSFNYKEQLFNCNDNQHKDTSHVSQC
jgi:hypothetical protein